LYFFDGIASGKRRGSEAESAGVRDLSGAADAVQDLAILAGESGIRKGMG
jgi:hypothetical protein